MGNSDRIRSGGESGPNGCGRLGQRLEHAIFIQSQILDVGTPLDWIQNGDIWTSGGLGWGGK